MPEEVKQAYQEYVDKYNTYKEKYISWLKETKGFVFRLKDIPSYHFHDPFEGDSSTTYNCGFCKIIGENHGKPIVRYMHMDIVVRQNMLFPDQEILNNTRYYVNIHNFTGYTYESLMDIIGDKVDEEDLIPFVKDIMNDDYELKGYMVDPEDVKNNTPPWWRRHSREEKYIYQIMIIDNTNQ